MKAVKKNNKHHESPRFGNIHHTSIEFIYHCWQYYKYCLEYTVSFDLMTFHSNSAEASNTPKPPWACGVHWFQKRLRHPQGFQISQLEKNESKWKALDGFTPHPGFHWPPEWLHEGIQGLNFDLPLLKLWKITKREWAQKVGSWHSEVGHHDDKRWVDLFFRWSIN